MKWVGCAVGVVFGVALFWWIRLMVLSSSRLVVRIISGWLLLGSMWVSWVLIIEVVVLVGIVRAMID